MADGLSAGAAKAEDLAAVEAEARHGEAVPSASLRQCDRPADEVAGLVISAGALALGDVG